MKLRYESDGELVTEFTDLEYMSCDNKFILKGLDSEPLEYHPILNLDPEYSLDDFSIELLNNEDSTENSIYTVKIKIDRDWGRIGWVFPIQALLSREHTQAENEFFLKYAYIATYILLNNIECTIDIGEDGISQELLLEKLYDPNTNLLVIDHNNCKAVSDFNLNHYIIGLSQYGYSWTGKIQGTLPLPESKDNSPGHINLNCISSEIDHEEIINMIFKEQLPQKLPVLLRFYYSYQIIEILIQEIFENEFQKLLGHISVDTEKLFDVREDVNNIAGEKNRVKKLFNIYTDKKDITSRNELNEECINILKYFGRKTYTDLAGNLYAVRCLLVHKMYAISTADKRKLIIIDGMIIKINILLLAVLQNLLFSFHKD